VLAFCLTSSVYAATIIWVSDNKGNDSTDQGWIDLLVAQGYTVDLNFRNQEGRSLNATEIAALNATDLIIISRDTDSGNYDDGDEPTQWNSITTPLILQVAHIYRSNRWRWMDSTSTSSTTNNLLAVLPDHPIFSGVTLDANNEVDILTAQSNVGNDNVDPTNNYTLIATRAGSGQDGVWIAEWEKGVEFYPGSGQYAGGHRMYFAAGGSEGDNVDGRYNLTAEGEKLFLNAVSYMLGEFDVEPEKASEPNPADQDPDAPYKAVLSWAPGAYAPATNGHKVYFSENFDDVSDGIGGTVLNSNRYPESGTLSLDFNTTYYWRVDEANVPTSGWDEGNIWQFTTELFAYPIPSQTITATASSQAENQGPENTVNSSGLDDNDLHLKETAAMWLSSSGSPELAWIEYEFDKIYKLHEMWVWNFNGELILSGFGLKNVTIEYSANGTNYTRLGDTHEFAQATGGDGYAHNTTVNFDGVAAKYVRITANSNWGGAIYNQYGLSEVRFFYIPIHAREPNPEDGAADVNPDVFLSWRAGREAAEHDVYFSTNEQAVIDGTALVTNVDEAIHGPLSLDLGKTYYWKINEVNMAETPSTWEGDLWSFSIIDHVLVDDMDGFNDTDNPIWRTWKDGEGWSDPQPGWGGNGSGAVVELSTSIARDRQSLLYYYDHDGTNFWGTTGKAYYSEAKMTLSSPRDWAAQGIKALSLWFIGYPGSIGSFTDNFDGTYTMTAGGADIYGDSDEFHFAFKELNGAGTIIAKVESVENTNGFAKAGVMIRDSLDPNSANAALLITPENGVRLQYRNTTGGNTERDFNDTIAAPQWVKLTRELGGRVRAAYSVDGATWTDMDPIMTVIMDLPMYIGMAVTSHEPGVACEAVFSNVTSDGTGTWVDQDIGMITNQAEPMYVAIANNTGDPAVVYHDDPNASLISTWTPWKYDDAWWFRSDAL
jgi:hypothetical protein